MITLIRTCTLNTLRTDLATAQADAQAARAEADECAEVLRAELAQSRLEAARLEGELRALRAQVLLDTEDRQALRTLLRATRKQNQRAERVYVLFRFGELHSVHATSTAAEIAAEAEGAARDGWTPHTTCCDGTTVPASQVRWRIQPVLLGATR